MTDAVFDTLPKIFSIRVQKIQDLKILVKMVITQIVPVGTRFVIP